MPNQANEISHKGDNPDDIFSHFQQSNPVSQNPLALVKNICSPNSYRGRNYSFEKQLNSGSFSCELVEEANLERAVPGAASWNPPRLSEQYQFTKLQALP